MVDDGRLRLPSGLCVFGGHLYWTDRSAAETVLERVNKTSGGGRERLVAGQSASAASRLTDVVVVRRLDAAELRRSACGRNNGGCSHLCVSLGSGGDAGPPAAVGRRRCSCPVGLMLAGDGRSCSEPPTCGPDKFACGDGYCVPASWRCDGYADCENAADEANCSTGGGRCSRCDGRPHCPQDDDGGQFRCHADRTCVVASRVCDGRSDCADGSDERNCSTAVAATPPGTAAAGSSVHFAVGIGVVGSVLVLAFAVLLSVCVCRQKSSGARRDGPVDRRDIVLVTTLPPAAAADLSEVDYSSSLLCGGIVPPPPSATSLAAADLPPDDDSDSPLYDRDHITGASSSSSLTTTAIRIYPKETLNPPPSPATERSLSLGGGGCRFVDGVAVPPPPPPPKRRGRARGAYGRRRRKHRAPPTTPCSTDVCDDSGSCLGHVRCHGGVYYDCRRLESDPLCPPPTPRSHCLSDERASCRSSPPSTECSYFVSVPPPPPSSTFTCSD